MFLNIQIDLIILNTYDQQFTLTTKKSLHIIFNAQRRYRSSNSKKMHLLCGKHYLLQCLLMA